MAADLTPDEERRAAADDAAHRFGLACRTVEEHTPKDSETALTSLVTFLATELWDNGFSSEEIRDALQHAAKDVFRYAGRDERNGAGIRGFSLR